MNSQELRALQEAYMEVYDNKLCEELTGSRRQTAVEKKASSRLTHGFHGSHTDDGKITKFQTKLGGKGKKGKGKSGLNLPGYELDRGTGNKAARRAGKFVKNTRDDGRDSWDESFDLYDIILSHLLDEGYADTNEAALAIMANMSEDWRESIVEVLDTPEKANEYAKKNVKSMLGAFAKGVVNKDITQLKTIQKRGEGAKMAKRKAERKAAEEG